jgi:hypothetical protein
MGPPRTHRELRTDLVEDLRERLVERVGALVLVVLEADAERLADALACVRR